MSVVDRVLATLNAHDVEGFVACYDGDATIEDGYDHVAMRGRKELRTRYAALFEQHEAVQVEALSRVVVGEFVVQHERVTGRGVPTEHVAVYLVRNDSIVRERLVGA